MGSRPPHSRVLSSPRGACRGLRLQLDRRWSRRRHLSRASGRHRCAPAHQRARASADVSRLVAGWHPHRLPRLGGRKRLPCRHRRGRRQRDDTGHDGLERGVLRTGRPGLVTETGMTLVFPSTRCARVGLTSSSCPADGSSPATRLLAPGMEGQAADWSPDGETDRLPGQGRDRQRRLLCGRCKTGDGAEAAGSRARQHPGL